MSSKTDVVQKWHEKSWSNPPSSLIEANEIFLSDSFQATDKDGKPTLNKAGMSAMVQIFSHAFESFRGVVHDLQEEQDGTVTMTFHFEGRHIGDLDLSAMGLGVIPATGIEFLTPESKTIFTVEGDQIVRSQAISGGFDFVMAAIGAIPSE